MSNLKEKALKGLLWSGTETFLIQVLTFIFSIVLLRILTPRDFGIVGQALAFVGFSQILIDAGFGMALIQKKKIDDEYLSTVFWINIVIGISLFFCFYLSAPFIERFFNNEGLTLLVRVLSFSFILASFNVVQRTIYKRNIDLKRLSIINITAFLGSNITAIVMGLYGWNEWSLVFRFLLNYSIASIFLWGFSSFKPSFQFSIEKMKELSGFSMNVLGITSLSFLSRKGDKIVIGKYIGDEALGIYDNAYRLLLLTVSRFTTSVQKVLFPAFSRLQDQPEKISKYLLLVLDSVSIVFFPLLMISYVLAEPFILTLFGKKWEGMIFIFEIFCFVSFFRVINPIIVSTLLAVDKSKLVLSLNVISKTILFTAVFLGVTDGINGVAVAILIASIINFTHRIYFSGKALGISHFSILKPLLLNIFFSFVISSMLIFIMSLDFFPEGNLLKLLLGGSIGGTFYFLLIFTVKNKEILDFLKKRRNSRLFKSMKFDRETKCHEK